MRTLIPPVGCSTERLTDALGVAERVASLDRSNLYLTSQFFEDRSRYDAFIAMYAVMRVIDDFVDAVPDRDLLTRTERNRMLHELDGWAVRIRSAFAGKPRFEPLDLALSAAVRTFPVSIEHWIAFVEAMRFDVRKSRFDDFAEFLRYGEGATVAPTSIYLYLLTSRRQADGRYLVEDFDYAACGRELGLFAYLVHVLRDLRMDLGIGGAGLVYLSTADLHAHALTEGDLRELVAGRAPDVKRVRWRGLVREICARARVMRARGNGMANDTGMRLSRDCAFILRLIIDIYTELLNRIDADPEQILGGEPGFSDAERAQLVRAAAAATGYALADSTPGAPSSGQEARTFL